MKKSQISKRVLIVACVLLLAAFSIATGSVIAKYVENIKTESDSVTAKAFYFESDYLLPTGHQYELNSTVDSVSFELRNFENELRISQVKCTYEITIESDDSNFTVKVNEGEAEKHTSLELTANADVKTTHKITLEGLQSGKKYKVTVTAKGGYQKTLSATFSVAENKSGFYMNVEETETYVLLTVWTEGDRNGKVTINVPAGLIPDTTDPIMANIDDYDGNTYTIFDNESFQSEFSSRSYRFFKDTNYAAANFTLTITKDGVTTEAEDSNIP